MTLAALALSGMLAAAGTRLAVVGLISAAAIGATGDGVVVPAATWTPALAAALLLLGGSPRRMAVPLLGATAVLAAGSASNAAVVLVAWVVGSAGAVLSREERPAANRWALGLLASDLPVMAAIVYTASEGGFVDWPQSIGTPAAAALLIAVVAKIPLVGSQPGAGYAGILVVRTQVTVLAIMSLTVAPAGLREAGAVAGAVAFAAASRSSPAMRDGAQEGGLLLLAVSSSTLGLSPLGWSWGVLAGGTLMHCLRVVAGRDGAVGPVARLASGSGGAWLPILPGVVAAAAAGAGRGGWLPGLVFIALGAGLAGRASRRTPRGAVRPKGRSRWERSSAVAVLALAGGPALWAGLLTLPRPPAAHPVPWPPIWAGAIVLVAAAAGLFIPSLAPAREGSSETPPSRLARAMDRVTRDRLVRSRSVLVLLLVLVVVAVALWVMGSLRGFL